MSIRKATLVTSVLILLKFGEATLDHEYVDNAAPAKPKMRVNGEFRSELAIKEFEEIRIECWGQDIVFECPDDMEKNVTRPTDPGEPFVLLVEGSYSNAGGWYDCYEKSAPVRSLRNEESLEYDNVSSVFVYVDSAGRSLMTDRIPSMMYIQVNHTLVIPCYPDTPNRTVTCVKEEADTELEVRYVDKIGCVVEGFRLERVYDVKCELDDDSIEWSFIPLPNTPTPLPTIEYSGLGNPYMENDRLELNCTVKRASPARPAEMIWLYPSSVEPDRVQISDLNYILGSNYEYRRTLVIEKLLPTDGGFYTCMSFESFYVRTTAISVLISVEAASKLTHGLDGRGDTRWLASRLKIFGISSPTSHR